MFFFLSLSLVGSSHALARHDREVSTQPPSVIYYYTVFTDIANKVVYAALLSPGQHLASCATRRDAAAPSILIPYCSSTA